MSESTKTLALVGTVARIASLLERDFPAALEAHVADDPDIALPSQWGVHRHIAWEAGVSGAVVDFPALFVHAALRSAGGSDGEIHRAGPDLQVGFCLRSHRDRLAANTLLGAHVIDTLFQLAVTAGYFPHVHGFGSYGRPESIDWTVAGTVLFGLVDGAPGLWGD